MGRRSATVLLCLGGLFAVAEAEAQATGPAAPRAYWSTDFSASAMLSPGIGGSAKAAGGTGSVTVVRSHSVPEEFITTCVGARVTFAAEWSDFGSAAGLIREQWLVAGPVRERHDTTEAAFVSLHPFVGIKRSSLPVAGGGSTSDVSSAVYGVRLSLGFGIAPIAGHEAAVRSFDVTYLGAPGDPVAPHRLVFSFGLDISRRLGR